MVVTVTFNPCVDHLLVVDQIKLHDRNKVVKVETDAGGKGVNLSRMVAALGCPTLALGFLGGQSGLFVKKVLEHEGVPQDFVEIHGETRTNVSIESGDGPPTVFGPNGPEVGHESWNELLKKVEGLLQPGSWLCLGGSMPPSVPSDANSKLTRIAHEVGAKVLLDADGKILTRGLKDGPDMVKPNEDETERLVGYPIDSLGTALRAAKEISQSMLKDNSLVVVSVGENGAVLCGRDELLYGVPPKIRAQSTIGSGDSFNGAFLARLLEGDTVDEAFRWGLAAGTATAVSDGSHIGSIQDIRSFLPRTKVFKGAEIETLDRAFQWPTS